MHQCIDQSATRELSRLTNQSSAYLYHVSHSTCHVSSITLHPAPAITQLFRSRPEIREKGLISSLIYRVINKFCQIVNACQSQERAPFPFPTWLAGWVGLARLAAGSRCWPRPRPGLAQVHT